jgi:hypothetical protein
MMSWPTHPDDQRECEQEIELYEASPDEFDLARVDPRVLGYWALIRPRSLRSIVGLGDIAEALITSLHGRDDDRWAFDLVVEIDVWDDHDDWKRVVEPAIVFLDRTSTGDHRVAAAGLVADRIRDEVLMLHPPLQRWWSTLPIPFAREVDDADA